MKSPFQHAGIQHLLGALCAVIALLATTAIHAGHSAAYYIEPHFGAATVILKAVEIDSSFLSAVTQKDVSLSWYDITSELGEVPVGRLVGYKGSGAELGVTTGVKISGLKLGFTFTWIHASFAGYSKKYRYSPDAMRARGKKLMDTDTLPVFRVMGTMKYGIPIRKLMLNLQTRLGKMIIRDTSLIVGRAIEKDHGFTADVGIELAARPSKWVSFGFLGYGGFFAFAGKYEFAMGGVFGGNGVVCVYF